MERDEYYSDKEYDEEYEEINANNVKKYVENL